MTQKWNHRDIRDYCILSYFKIDSENRWAPTPMSIDDEWDMVRIQSRNPMSLVQLEFLNTDEEQERFKRTVQLLEQAYAMAVIDTKKAIREALGIKDPR